MGIKNKGPKLWEIKVSVRVPGKDYPVKKQVQFRGTKTEAEAKRVELIKKIRSGNTERSLTIKTFGEGLLIYCEKKGPFSSSHSNKVNFIQSELKDVLLPKFADVFEVWVAEYANTPTIHGKKRSPASYNRIVEIVKSVFSILVSLRYLDKNPITSQRFPKRAEKPRDRYLLSEERLRLIKAIKLHRPYLLPFLAYNLAVPCRKGELVYAKKEQYNQFTNTIYVPDSKADIPIYKPVPEEMKTYFRSIPDDCPWLFYRTEGGKDGKPLEYHPLGDFKKAWAYCIKKAGIAHVRIHDLRHVAATDLYAAGNPERMIMDIAGWKTPMLSTYRHKNSLQSAQNIKFTSPQQSIAESDRRQAAATV